MDLRSRWLLFFFTLFTPLALINAQTGAMEPATILVASASGTVTVSDLQTGTFKPLQKGMKITEGVTVQTGENGSALLLFPNGSAVTIKKNTTLDIEEHKLSPIKEGTPNLKNLENEPSTSKTKLRLNQGDIIGTVKKLNVDKGSTFEIDSPIGTAGIRGTVWTMSVTISENGEATGSFGISVGNGFFIPLGGAEQYVGSEVVINVTIGRNALGQPVITAIRSGQLPIRLFNEMTLDSEDVKKAFEALSGEEFEPEGEGEVGGNDNNRQRAKPNTIVAPVTPNQGEGSTTSGPQ
ncbi:FecR family protein [Rubellicoccus peritrichatus]|uniref:FecR domain-containing protein n=1 Tax=Rubellicoccus peritrichatus TaxID=3080537 RepID=A0AAQ3QT23_9BACT|nr:FecR domain-containing protein [Puniceicoccus sp. CR14]WOO43223.1 FecR domain-containing protein [Puniceicoccus sp. CR14]